MAERLYLMELGIRERMELDQGYSFNQLMFAASEHIPEGINSTELSKVIDSMMARSIIIATSKGGKSRFLPFFHEEGTYFINPFGELMNKAKEANA